jgi:Icc-related predicted phosphoesterase
MASLSSRLSATFSFGSKQEEVRSQEKGPLEKVTIVCVSDTHGRHRDVFIPEGDILIHAGDFTHFGKIADAEDFNQWLGEQPHRHKIVVNGNHESNSDWKDRVSDVLSNATHLCQRSVTLKVREADVTVFGTQFFWPMKTQNPYYAEVTQPCDILVCHGPVAGMVDGGVGCSMLRETVERVKPRLVVSGHIHKAHGQREAKGIIFVNAANAKDGYTMGNPAKYIELMVPARESEGIDSTLDKEANQDNGGVGRHGAGADLRDKSAAAAAEVEVAAAR